MNLFARKRSLSSLAGLACTAMLLVGCAVDPVDDESAPQPAADEESDNLGTSQEALRTTNLTFSADLTGDGKAETITVTPSNAFIVNGRTWVQHGGAPLEAGQIQFPDVNGDHKADVVVQGYDNRFWVSRSTGSTFTAPQNWVSHGGPYIAGRVHYGDVNGDGKADLVLMGNDHTFWVSTSTGTSFHAPQNWYNTGGPSTTTVPQFLLRDTNGDKKADLLFVWLPAHGVPFWFVGHSTGSAFAEVDACGAGSVGFTMCR